MYSLMNSCKTSVKVEPAGVELTIAVKRAAMGGVKQFSQWSMHVLSSQLSLSAVRRSVAAVRRRSS
jgi:hypothetical protein